MDWSYSCTSLFKIAGGISQARPQCIRSDLECDSTGCGNSMILFARTTADANRPYNLAVPL